MTDVSAEFRRQITREFPALRGMSYLDTACMGIAPRRAVRAVSDFAHSTQFCPAGSGTAQHGRLNEDRAATRPLAARLIGAAPEDIALVESTTHGLSVAARALPLRAGDQILMCDLEFIQMGAVWSQLEKDGIGLRVVPNRAGTITADTVRAHLSPEVRVLAVSSVQWTNGFRADLESLAELCRARDIWLVVDAAQHVGALPMNVGETPVDVLACGGHKWLNSPFGTGILYLSPRARARMKRPLAGFFAAQPPARTWGESFLHPELAAVPEFAFTDEARAWEVGGTGNYAGALGLAASLSLVLEIGQHRIAEHIDELTGRLVEGLDRRGIQVVSPRGDHQRSGIVTFTVGQGQPDIAVMRHLLSQDVAVGVRYISGVGGVRVSCHGFNDEQDIGRLLDSLDDWAQRRSRGKPDQGGRTRAARRATAQIARQRSLIDALDDDLIGLVTARGQVSRGIRLSGLEGSLPRTDLAREREVVERFHHRLGPAGTRIALELLRLCRGHT
ncbi:aminotransferase class V-fold PLP-dependent enzyme [Streptomyces sp. NPDC060184]|uniref:aminotransferase class V-fold PLP-dependent enzyme n=1 Tax=Streptomyces sp. NPDC060184 TaxID=3347064 RepID=UPI0036592715